MRMLGNRLQINSGRLTERSVGAHEETGHPFEFNTPVI